MRVKKIPQPEKLRKAEQLSAAQLELQERANEHILRFTELMFPCQKGEARFSITEVPLPDKLEAILAFSQFCEASFEIRSSEFLDGWVFATAVLDKILVALNALLNCFDREKNIPLGHKSLIIDNVAANLEKIFPKVYELCLERIKLGNPSDMGKKIKNPLNKARFNEICHSARTNIENVKKLRGQTSAILQLLRWPGPDSYKEADTPNWNNFNLEKIIALAWAIANLLETSDVQNTIERAAEDFLFDASPFWRGITNLEHVAYLADLLPKPNVFMRLAAEDAEFKKDPENQAQIRKKLSARSEYFGDDLFRILRPELMPLLAAGRFSNLELISRVFRGPSANQFIFDYQAQREKLADELARLLAEEVAAEEEARLERYRLRMQTKRAPAQAKEDEHEEQPQAVEKAEQSPAAEPSEILIDLHNLMRNVSISIEEKIDKIKRIFRDPNLNTEEKVELHLALAELILKQKDVKPRELEEQIANLDRCEKNDWVLALLDELNGKLTELNEARARVKDRSQAPPPKKKTFCLVPPEVKAVLASLEDFWGTAYMVGGFPRNHFAKIEAKTDIDLVVIGCPYDFFANPEYRKLLSQQLGKKLAKDVAVNTTKLDRLLEISIDSESYDVWFSEEKRLGLELNRRDFYCNTICVNKHGQAISFFPSAILDAEGKKCKPVKGWQEFFKDPIRLLRLIKMTELGPFSLEDEKQGDDKKMVGAEFKRIRSFSQEQRREWLKENPLGFEIYLKKVLRAALKKYLKGEEHALRKIILLLGTALVIERAPEFLCYNSFVALVRDLQKLEPKKPSLAAGPHVFQVNPAEIRAVSAAAAPSC